MEETLHRAVHQNDWETIKQCIHQLPEEVALKELRTAVSLHFWSMVKRSPVDRHRIVYLARMEGNVAALMRIDWSTYGFKGSTELDLKLFTFCVWDVKVARVMIEHGCIFEHLHAFAGQICDKVVELCIELDAVGCVKSPIQTHVDLLYWLDRQPHALSSNVIALFCGSIGVPGNRHSPITCDYETIISSGSRTIFFKLLDILQRHRTALLECFERQWLPMEMVDVWVTFLSHGILQHKAQKIPNHKVKEAQQYINQLCRVH